MGFRNRNNRRMGGYGGYGGGIYGGYGRQGLIWPWILIILVLIGGAMYLKGTGKLGHVKNRVFKTPTEQVAAVNQGIAKDAQANKNLAKHDQYNNGDMSAKNGIINDPVLLKDQFNDLNDMYSFGKVYSIFVFSNSKADTPWLDQITSARKNGLRVLTLYGKDISEQDNPMIYNMFTRDFQVSKESKEYGKQTGKDYPFMILLQNGKITNIVTKQSEEKKLFKLQEKVQKKVDAKANNYEMPDNGIGVPYPDWNKYAKETGKFVKSTYNNVKDNLAKSSSDNNDDNGSN